MYTYIYIYFADIAKDLIIRAKLPNPQRIRIT